MPNQLADRKRRLSLAEHKLVLAALAEVARHEGTTPTALVREGVRSVVGARAADPGLAGRLRDVAMRFAPKPPSGKVSAAQLARFKCDCREFDRTLIDLRLSTPLEIQARNSIVPPGCKVRVLELENCNGDTQPAP
jgi:hypothetical protein